MSLIFGLVGEKVAGKDTAAIYLKEKHNFFHIRHTHILNEILNSLGIEISRENEIALGMGLRETFGQNVLANAVSKRISEQKNSNIVINGIRFQNEFENAKNLGAKIIYITAPLEIRYKRALERKEKTDDAAYSLEQFKVQESGPTEIQIPALGAQADFSINNDGDLNNLYYKLEEIFTNLEGKNNVQK